MSAVRRASGGELFFLAAITGVGAFLRFYRIGKECLWFDEIYVMGRAADSLDAIMENLFKDLGALFPPLYFLLLRMWSSLFSLSPGAIRSFSALWGVIAIPVAYLLAKEMFGRRAAVAASTLLAFSSFNVYYSQEAKMYAMWWTLVLASTLFFVRAVKYGARWQDLLPYSVLTAAALWAHNFPALAVLSQVAYLAAVRRPRGMTGRWLCAYLLAAVLYLPWVCMILARVLRAAGRGEAGAVLELTRQAVAWIPTPSFKDFIMSFVIFSTGLKMYVFDLDTWSNAWYAHFPFAPTLCILLLALLLHPLLRAEEGDCRFGALIVIMILFPCVSVFIYSRTMRPLWHPRYLGFVSALLFIAIGYGYSLSARKLLSGAALGVLLVLNLFVLDFYFSDRVKMPWDDLVVYLSPRASRGAIVLFPYLEMKRSLEYYWDLDEERRARELTMEYPYDDEAAARERIAECDDAWMVLHSSVDRGCRSLGEEGVEVAGYREERMYFGNGLEIVHYVREQVRSEPGKRGR